MTIKKCLICGKECLLEYFCSLDCMIIAIKRMSEV